MPVVGLSAPCTIASLLTIQALALAELSLDSLAVNIRIQRPAGADPRRP